MSYVDSLPLVAGPGIFGLHDNANIACALNETFSIFDTILSLQVGLTRDMGGLKKGHWHKGEAT
jgi:dynein heavy chain